MLFVYCPKELLSCSFCVCVDRIDGIDRLERGSIGPWMEGSAKREHKKGTDNKHARGISTRTQRRVREHTSYECMQATTQIQNPWEQCVCVSFVCILCSIVPW